MKVGDNVYCHSSYSHTENNSGRILTAGNFYKIIMVYNRKVKPIMASDDENKQIEHYCEISSDFKVYSLIFMDYEEFSLYCYTLSEYRKKKLEKIHEFGRLFCNGI